MSSEYEGCVGGARSQGVENGAKGTENSCLGAETNPSPKIYLFQSVSLFTCSFLYSITYSFKECLLSIYSEPRTLPGTGRSNLKATCPQGQGFLPRMFCPLCCSVRSSWIPQFSLDVQQNSVCLHLKAQTCLLGCCSFNCQHLCYCVKAIIHFKGNLLIG